MGGGAPTGFGTDEALDTIYKFDPSTEGWNLRPETIGGERAFAGVAVVGPGAISCT